VTAVPPRRPDWQAALTGYLASCAARPFEPGQHDCALFAAGAVAAMTGHDPAAPYRGRYTTILGGQRVLRRDGHADAVALAAALFRARSVGEAAAPGDLAVIDGEGGRALGVVQGAFVYAPGALGLVLVALDPAAIVFEVP
jgi:hypothetical protein